MKVFDLKKSGYAPSLFASFLYFDVSFMIWVLLGSVGVFIANDFGLSPSEKGLIVAIPILSGSIFRLILGLLTDQIGPRKTAILGMTLTMIPLIWGWQFGNNIGEIYAIGILLGVSGASFSAALPLASRWYPPHLQGLAMGIAGAGNSGTLFATLFGPRLAKHYGWHGVMGFALIPLLIVFITFMLIAKEPPSQPPAKPLKDYFKVFKHIDTWYFCFLYSTTFGGFVGLSNFLSIFFVDQYDLSKVTAGDFVTLCVAAGSFSRPIGGFLADKFGGVRILILLFICSSICMFWVSKLPSLPLVISLLFIGMSCLGMGNGSIFQLIPQRFQNEIGIITGIVGAAGGVGGFFVPTLLATLKQITGTYAIGFLTYAVVIILSLVVLLYAQAIWKKTWALQKNSLKFPQDYERSDSTDSKIISG